MQTKTGKFVLFMYQMMIKNIFLRFTFLHTRRPSNAVTAQSQIITAFAHIILHTYRNIEVDRERQRHIMRTLSIFVYNVLSL